MRLSRRLFPFSPLVPFGHFLGVSVLFLSVLLLACYGTPDSCTNGFGDEFRRSDQPQDIDPRRFRLITVGMVEAQVIEILGLPLEARGPQVQSILVPDVLNPEDCDHKVPCQCGAPVRELFYYRGDLSESFYVYIDSAGTVCCYQRSHAMRFSMTAI